MLRKQSQLAQKPLPETNLFAQGFKLIAGVDEVGRGCLAGPVVAACCILPQQYSLPGLNDSKKLSPKKRETLFKLIQEQALAYSIAFIDSGKIDQINILQASLLAMRQSIESINLQPDYVLIDGRDALQISIPQKPIINGDSLSPVISAASILAKVTRDNFMAEQEAVFPGFTFAQHKGYGTRQHLAELKQYGPSVIHRRSFKGVED